jgi:ADP-heptose:LPS heptosyltransferase
MVKKPIVKKILFRVSGGLGKNILGTAVAKQIRLEYPGAIVHVQASYPRAFTALSGIDRIYGYQANPDFRDVHQEYEIIAPEPYLDLEYRKKNRHLVDAWCDMAGVRPPNKKAGEINLSSREREYAKLRCQRPMEKKLIAVQFFGGTSYYSAQDAGNPHQSKHYRDLSREKAQEIVNGLVQAGNIVLQIALPTEPQLQNAMQIMNLMPNPNQIPDPRLVWAIMEQCDALITVDTQALHAWHALGKSGAIVLWGGTHQNCLGYPDDINMTNKECKCPDIHCMRPDGALGDVEGDGPWVCPRDAECMQFEPERIVTEVQKKFTEHVEKAA